MRTPNGAAQSCSAAIAISCSNSPNFSITGTTFLPRRWAETISDSMLRSLTPLQISSVSSESSSGRAAISSAREPHSRPSPNGLPASSTSWTTSGNWLTLIGETAR